MKLVIVESPAKCETIKKYLGSEYDVVASKGHIRDLSTSGKGGLGVDVENDFTPSYVISKDKFSIVKQLQDKANLCDEVILATDPDREGEAIAWHLSKVLGLDINKTKRLEFHEITKESIVHAIGNPRTINTNIVSSQEARRILDRIIGFRLSNLLYKKMKSRSAGRVQSAALKLIADHDIEIEKFVPEEYWNIKTKINLCGLELNPTFVGKNNKEIEINSKDKADKILDALGDELIVSNIDKSFRFKESKVPLTTSSLQQEAFARLKFNASKTMKTAQKLYEGVNVGGEHVGLITYMRTDSTRLSQSFTASATKYIKEKFGNDYFGAVKGGRENENAQDAHEGIRPTSVFRTPESVKQYLAPEQYKLYKLIYCHTLASMMKAKKDEVFTVKLNDNSYQFKVEFAKTIFLGYEVIYKDEEENDDKTCRLKLPNIHEGDKATLLTKEGEQKFTQAPAPYTEAKLVRLMEEVGIGRPSTYATTIETLKARKYVTDEKGVLKTTEQGRRTAHVLDKYFPDFVNANYTAIMETNLDDIESGQQSRLGVLTDFYNPFIELLDSASKKMYVDDLVETGEMCPKCGSPLVYKEGKNGTFIGCSNYPKCKYVKKEEKPVKIIEGEFCPECGAPLCEREDSKGKKFIACSAYPKCKYIKQEEIVYTEKDYVKDCPDCGGHLVKKKGKYGYFLGCTNYPECKHMEKIKKNYKRK